MSVVRIDSFTYAVPHDGGIWKIRRRNVSCFEKYKSEALFKNIIKSVSCAKKKKEKEREIDCMENLHCEVFSAACISSFVFKQLLLCAWKESCQYPILFLTFVQQKSFLQCFLCCWARVNHLHLTDKKNHMLWFWMWIIILLPRLSIYPCFHCLFFRERLFPEELKIVCHNKCE